MNDNFLLRLRFVQLTRIHTMCFYAKYVDYSIHFNITCTCLSGKTRLPFRIEILISQYINFSFLLTP